MSSETPGFEVSVKLNTVSRFYKRATGDTLRTTLMSWARFKGTLNGDHSGMNTISHTSKAQASWPPTRLGQVDRHILWNMGNQDMGWVFWEILPDIWKFIMILKCKCCHFDEIFITGCTGSCHFDNFRCSQWWKFHQNDNISVTVNGIE